MKVQESTSVDVNNRIRQLWKIPEYDRSEIFDESEKLWPTNPSPSRRF